MNQFMTICALGMGAAQIIFAINFCLQHFLRPEVRAQSLAREQRWNGLPPARRATAISTSQPIVYRGPYEYGSPEIDRRLLPADPAASRRTRSPTDDHGHSVCQ